MRRPARRGALGLPIPRACVSRHPRPGGPVRLRSQDGRQRPAAARRRHLQRPPQGGPAPHPWTNATRAGTDRSGQSLPGRTSAPAGHAARENEAGVADQRHRLCRRQSAESLRSLDTVPCRRARRPPCSSFPRTTGTAPMRPGFASLLTIMTLATPLAGQAAPGHVYWVGFYQALPGKAAAYSKALTDIADPVLDELVRRKQMISHVQLAQYTGAGENTNLVILEFPNWAALDTYEAKLEEASQAVLHKPWGEATAGFAELRRLVRLEIYTPVHDPLRR